MDLMRLTRDSLLELCWELDIQVDDDTPASELREIIVESKNNQEDVDYFGNLILRNQEKQVEQAKWDEECERLEHECERLERLMRLTKDSLLQLCWELDIEVDDDMPAYKIREIIVGSKNKEEDIDYFWNLILSYQEQKIEEAKRVQQHRKEMQAMDEEIERLERGLDRKQRSGQSVDVAHERCEEQSSAVQFRAVGKASTCEDSSRFKNEPRLAAAKDAALRGEAAEGQNKCDKVLCQWNSRETAKTVVEKLAQTPSESIATVDFACGVPGYFDPRGKNTSVSLGSGANEVSREHNAVGDSSQVCELGCSEENSCVVPQRVKLSASLEREEKDYLYVNHLDCAGETASESSESADQQEMRAGCSKMSPKKRRRRKRHRRARSAGKGTTSSKKGFECLSVVGRERRLSSATKFCMRPSRRTKRKRKAHCAQVQSQGRSQSASRRSIHGAFDGARECSVGGSQEVAERGEECRPPTKSLGGFGGEANGFRDCCSPPPTRKAHRERPPRVRLKNE
ncbi:uncharacterized protein LOC125756990 [Rhipicephalus sanguineus]|uniref:uncharacterized protein LOC125756990 n=1 Tax=Rhipicephalus sanguineus TaxID=34632 RepID=UPI0020C2B49E|nr:uncharacterized protein LOC125756990 [Rhipicephalus sanguineus]